MRQKLAKCWSEVLIQQRTIFLLQVVLRAGACNCNSFSFQLINEKRLEEFFLVGFPKKSLCTCGFS